MDKKEDILQKRGFKGTHYEKSCTMLCMEDYADFKCNQLLETMLPEQEKDYSDHFLEWRTKYFEKKPLLLSWKSGSGHFTTKQLETRYEKAFNLPPTK